MSPTQQLTDPVALVAARRLLDEASVATLALRSRVEALADATQWRSQATDAYCAGVAGLSDDLARLVQLIDAFEADLSTARRDALWQVGW
ncbi:MAG: hypothetical protein QM677_09865 [Microbacterium sp.]